MSEADQITADRLEALRRAYASGRAATFRTGQTDCRPVDDEHHDGGLLAVAKLAGDATAHSFDGLVDEAEAERDEARARAQVDRAACQVAVERASAAEADAKRYRDGATVLWSGLCTVALTDRHKFGNKSFEEIDNYMRKHADAALDASGFGEDGPAGGPEGACAFDDAVARQAETNAHAEAMEGRAFRAEAQRDAACELFWRLAAKAEADRVNACFLTAAHMRAPLEMVRAERDAACEEARRLRDVVAEFRRVYRCTWQVNPGDGIRRCCRLAGHARAGNDFLGCEVDRSEPAIPIEQMLNDGPRRPWAKRLAEMVTKLEASLVEAPGVAWLEPEPTHTMLVEGLTEADVEGDGPEGPVGP